MTVWLCFFSFWKSRSGSKLGEVVHDPRADREGGYVWVWLVNGRLPVGSLVVGRRYVSGEREFRAWVLPQIAGD